MRIGSLFSGYSGLDDGVRRAIGGDVAWHCEIEPAAVKVLEHHSPDVPNLGDITAVDWAGVEPVDVLTGGFPCQDVSAAGKRAGMKPDSRSGLWTHMARAVNVLRPRLVVIENVRGLLSADAACDLEPCPWCLGDERDRPLRALGAVLGDLSVLGYDAQWSVVRASDAGAPHPRARVFVIAWPTADPASLGWEMRRPEPAGLVGGSDVGLGGDSAWGQYGAVIRQWERVVGRPVPMATQLGVRGGPQLSPRFVEWCMGLDEGRVTAVPGLSRNEQLKLLGNGVVPAQADLAVRSLLLASATAHALTAA